MGPKNETRTLPQISQKLRKRYASGMQNHTNIKLIKVDISVTELLDNKDKKCNECNKKEKKEDVVFFG